MGNIEMHKTIEIHKTRLQNFTCDMGETQSRTRKYPSLCSFLPAVEVLNVCSAGFAVPLSCSDAGVQSSTKLILLYSQPQFATGRPLGLFLALDVLSALEGSSIVSVITLYNTVLLLLTFILTEGQLHPGLGLLIDQRQICQMSPALPSVMRCIDNYDTKCAVIIYRSFFDLTN